MLPDYADRFAFPGHYTTDARMIFVERLAIAEELGLDISDGSEALRIAAAEGKASLDAAVKASGLSAQELELRKAAGLPVDFPRGAVDQALAIFGPLGGLTCVKVEPRSHRNFPSAPSPATS